METIHAERLAARCTSRWAWRNRPACTTINQAKTYPNQHTIIIMVIRTFLLQAKKKERKEKKGKQKHMFTRHYRGVENREAPARAGRKGLIKMGLGILSNASARGI